MGMSSELPRHQWQQPGLVFARVNLIPKYQRTELQPTSSSSTKGNWGGLCPSPDVDLPVRQWMELYIRRRKGSKGMRKSVTMSLCSIRRRSPLSSFFSSHLLISPLDTTGHGPVGCQWPPPAGNAIRPLLLRPSVLSLAFHYYNIIRVVWYYFN